MRIPIYEQAEQELRQKKFPPDRIAFLGTDVAATNDKMTFRLFHSGEITLREACMRIAEANFLQEVTEEQFLNEAKLLGYARRRR